MKKYFILLISILFVFSCSVLDKSEQERYIFYNMKGMICIGKTSDGKAIFENPTGTKQYVCTNLNQSKNWNEGDTLFIKYTAKPLTVKDQKTFDSLKPYRK